MCSKACEDRLNAPYGASARLLFPARLRWKSFSKNVPPPLVDAKQRILIVGDWLYQLLVLGNKAGVPESPDTQRFLQSFSLVAQRGRYGRRMPAVRSLHAVAR
jgi:hypothetical protein